MAGNVSVTIRRFVLLNRNSFTSTPIIAELTYCRGSGKNGLLVVRSLQAKTGDHRNACAVRVLKKWPMPPPNGACTRIPCSELCRKEHRRRSPIWVLHQVSAEKP